MRDDKKDIDIHQLLKDVFFYFIIYLYTILNL